MLVIIAGLSLLLLLVIASLFVITPVRISAKGICLWWFLFVSSLAIFVWYAEPSVSDDLYRHYENINQIRNHGETIFNSSPLLVWRLMLWLVSLTDSNGWLPSMAVLIWGYAIGKITYDYIKTHTYSTRIIFIYFIGLLGSCSVFYLVSGVRCATSMAIWAYAYYFYYNDSKKKFYIVSLVSMGLHLLPLFMLFLSFIYERIIRSTKKYVLLKTIIFVFLISLLVRSVVVPQLLQAMSTPYVALVAQKWFDYMDRGIEDTVIVETRIKIFFLIVVLLIGLARKKIKIDFVSFIAITALSLIPMAILMERLPYFIGIYLLPTLNEWYMERYKYTPVIMIIVIGVFVFQSAFAVHEMFAHIAFGGYYLHAYF